MHEVLIHWRFSTADGVILSLLLVCYFYLVKFQWSKRSFFFVAALVLIVGCMYSPLHVRGAHELFSLHMLCHVILLLLAAPLLVASIPEENPLSQYLHKMSRWSVQHPFIFWICGVGIMWFWHVPWIFNALFQQMHHHQGQAWMVLHLWSLVVAGIFFYWPVLHPYKVFRLPPLNGILYLSGACLFCSILGLFIAFAPVDLYTSHWHYPVFAKGWSITASADQQMAGLIMWVPCCFIYLSVSMILLIRWLSQDEQTIISFINKHKSYEQERT